MFGVNYCMTTPAAIERHRVILGKEPTPEQVRLYTKFPEFRGFSGLELDEERAEATILLALTFGTRQDRVLFCAPSAHEDWVVGQFNKAADLAFAHCKTLNNKVVIAQFYRDLFAKVLLVGNLLPSEPTHWVAFGFLKDPTPDWMSKRLLP